MASHSWRRKSISGRDESSYSDLKERFESESPDRERDRDRIVRFELDGQSGDLVGVPLTLSLRSMLDDHPVLGHFSSLPSKENGIDIEGIASDGERLFLGFRGPVLRHGYVPILAGTPDRMDEAELLYVRLGGRGVRDLARVSGGFLIVAGAVGDSDLSYQLYFWDGADEFPGVREPGDPPAGRTVLLGAVPTPVDGKAETVVVLREEQGFWDLLILHDGIAGGHPLCLRASRP